MDQAGVPGAPIVDYLNSDPNGTQPEMWRSKQPDGTYALVVTNPSGTAKLTLNQGNNSITISAPGSSYAPDIDSIVIPSTTAQYLADAATFVGCNVRSNVTCTDGKCVTQVGMGNTIAFKNVTASRAGLHSVTILYLASNARTAEIAVNSGRTVKVDFLPTNSSDSNVVGAVSVNLPLNQGVNSIIIANRNAPAPDIDSIIVAE